jgi:hypothetical protein
MAGGAVARGYCVGKEGCLERRAHESTGSWIWEVGGRGRRVGKHIAVDDAASSHLLLHSRLDGVEGEIFPAMLSLELRKGETILQTTGNLKKRSVRSKQITGKHQACRMKLREGGREGVA